MSARASSLAALLTLAAAADSAPAQDSAASSPRSLTGIVGIGVVALPRYVGSDESRTLPIPIAALEFRGRVYLGGSQSGLAPGVGAHVVRTPSLTWDVGLTGTTSRSERRGNALAGLGRRSAAAFGTTGLAYRIGVVTASAEAAVGLGRDAGTYGTVGLGAELPVARRWVAGASTGATVADARHMAFDFGVTREQSAARRALVAAGDPRLRGIDVRAYAPRAGLKETRAAASLAYLLTERSRVVAFAQGTTLSGEAAHSPLVRRRTGTITGVAFGLGF